MVDKNNNSGHYNSGDYNSGHNNSGDYNSGHSNSGSYNSGSYNSGSYNSGDSNSGDSNSGYSNSGYCNSGHYNSGHSNSGHYNSGHSNSGHYNSGDYNSGFFNTDSPKVRLFNKESLLEFTDTEVQKLKNIIGKYWKVYLTYVYSKDMTEQEKLDNKTHETTGGFLRKDSDHSYKKSWQNVWSKCNDADKEFIKSLPNFDADIFEEITSVKIEDEIEVIVAGVTKKISKELAKQLGLI